LKTEKFAKRFTEFRMTFDSYKEIIEENDTVILYISFNTMHALTVTPTKVNKKGEENEHIYQCSYGGLIVKDLIGKRYGTRVQLSKGYAYVLYPTPELWTKTLPHRTQIIYATDISLVLLQLELKPGSIVIESGTGSGSLSHSFLRTIAPTGHLHTFDFHEQRVTLARKEFEKHKLGDLVTVKQRDVCQNGFDLENVADAVFLDLPHPWDAIPHAKRALKKAQGGRICSFSPCLEQVQKACAKLDEEGFIEISTMECLLREFQVRKITIPLYDHNKESSEYVPNTPAATIEDSNNKRKLEETSETNGDTKKPNLETSFVTGIPLTTMPGHTGYLTFATLKPDLSQLIN